MDKKLIAPRNLNRDLKNTGPKFRIPDFTNEKHSCFSSTKWKQYNYYRPLQHRNTNFKKAPDYPNESVSLSNEEYIHATSQIWLNQKCLKSNYDFDDIYSQWESIIQINFYKTEQDIVCPICMDVPKVCRTDKCGHVYCYPCLNRFLSYENGFYRKCALCNQEIDLKRVKRAAFIERFTLEVGDNISLLLMRRSKSDSFPVPIDVNKATIPFVYSNESRFSNTAVCSNEDLQTLIQIDILALEEELGDAIADGSDRIVAISDALEATRNELELSHLLPNVSKLLWNTNIVENNDKLVEIYAPLEASKNELELSHFLSNNSKMLHSAITEKSDRIDKISSAYEATLLPSSVSNLLCNTNLSVIEIEDLNSIMKTDYVYYQSEDGSNIFMCPVNWKCMSWEFLDKNNNNNQNKKCLPMRITGEIIEIEKFTITPDFINRYRYLKYLPIGSAVSFVEINLSNIVSDTTLKRFQHEIDNKSGNRRRREKIDNDLTTEKIKQENSFNVTSGFMCVSSLMNETIQILDDDFVPLSSTNVPTDLSRAPNVSVTSSDNKKKSFADLMHQNKMPTNPQMRLGNLSEATCEVQSRGFSLQDCLVMKPNKRNRKK